MSTEANRESAVGLRGEPQRLPSAPGDVLPPADLLPRTDTSLDLQAVVHDSSRFEWQVTLPLPRSGRVAYEVEAEFEIPSNALSGRSPWDLFQGFIRLDGDIATEGSSSSLNAVRQKAVALARMLDRARKGFSRHCHEAINRAPGE